VFANSKRNDMSMNSQALENPGPMDYIPDVSITK
jgi:hypothetical protein